jgi:hypothetical protein
VSQSLRRKLNGILAAFARCLGSKIRDARTGEVLGRGFLFAWRGRLHLIGYSGRPVAPVFLTQERLSYWRQTLGFTAHPEPDFEHVVRR